MPFSTEKGNNPALWSKLLEELEDKLQFGLLDKLKRVAAYHFEEDLLIIEAQNPKDREYLTKDAVMYQLTLFAEKVANIKQVRVD